MSVLYNDKALGVGVCVKPLPVFINITDDIGYVANDANVNALAKLVFALAKPIFANP